ncbi:MAG: hypothetical protein ACREQY_17100, partial [Candidatus Binatia bacterium]
MRFSVPRHVPLVYRMPSTVEAARSRPVIGSFGNRSPEIARCLLRHGLRPSGRVLGAARGRLGSLRGGGTARRSRTETSSSTTSSSVP